MLSKNLRIPRKYNNLLESPRFCSSTHFNVFFVESLEHGPRFGVTVSKKIAKRAVLRNRLRRLGYRAIAEHIKNIDKHIIARLVYRKVPADMSDIDKEVGQIIKKMVG